MSQIGEFPKRKNAHFTIPPANPRNQMTPTAQDHMRMKALRAAETQQERQRLKKDLWGDLG